MQLASTLTLLAGYFCLVTAIDLPDGAWEGTTLANGSYWVKAAGAPESERFLVEPTIRKREAAAPMARQSAWGGDCFPRDLNHIGVDDAVEDLKSWAGNGHSFTSKDANAWFGIRTRGVIVYYCITKAYTTGNLNVDDVNYALLQMDSHCVPYQASYFRWPGSFEIVGKDTFDAHFCA
ncbi:hypothetical protein CONLIGDRAFT_652575 [Coniochaeta ligniaria NRRL 30616]|uniref:Ecp2 effector protein domain-containing protein n=1 Tax=Coniochaeta ligniaria NRRL 30616 TaxID=1408157 RepID=A0A1J7IVL0_9PEZI|nr:hypothetical protein CONLIGDRAFT_652575 [Coniochaeta ligniaria NRRL 30616]